MRIAQIAPLAETVPPQKYGGTERVIYTLTQELVARGHDVTLFASGNSKTSAKLISVFPISLREAKLRNPYNASALGLLQAGYPYTMQEEFDIIHDHNGILGIATANLSQTPVVMTMHGAFNKNNKKAFQTFQNPNLVGISKAQVRHIGSINYIGNVYHGLNMEHYPFSPSHDGYLLYVGRISMEKGVHHAITVAKRLKLPLILAAKIDKLDRAYFQKFVKPHLSGSIRWIGEVDEKKRNLLMSRAMCFLHPVHFPEPFGLTLIESMACGLPVVAFDKGAIPEVVANGKSGFVTGTVGEMTDAVKHIDQIKRAECRQYALTTFSAQKMTDGYEAIYHQVVRKRFERMREETTERRLPLMPRSSYIDL